MIYIVDIDDTIATTPNVDGVNRYDLSLPLQHRIAHINSLYDEGHTIIYWTARGASTGIDWSEFTQNQLKEWGCKFHECRMNKPAYDIWIDDKAHNDQGYFNEIDRAWIASDLKYNEQEND